MAAQAPLAVACALLAWQVWMLLHVGSGPEGPPARLEPRRPAPRALGLGAVTAAVLLTLVQLTG